MRALTNFFVLRENPVHDLGSALGRMFFGLAFIGLPEDVFLFETVLKIVGGRGVALRDDAPREPLVTSMFAVLLAQVLEDKRMRTSRAISLLLPLY